ncbi:unnamed protein product [Cuscuta epithymum]|uniref:RNase H type-1 domain-containing protein n=1 Tax=Cuscuta epithymum TaxID=186058 RepID=A0AAV0EZ96_9ASTE|nr:unnamed protein product [Cuscuta epithymum]CAH9128594.1 unnamed protein product [Cuscuta epithymum]
MVAGGVWGEHYISFWFDHWLKDKLLCDVLGSPLADSARFVKVADFITSNKEWNVGKLEEMLPKDVVDNVRAVPLSMEEDIQDGVFWRLSGTGEITIKSAYEACFFMQMEDNMNWIWNISVPEKVRCFLWLIRKNKILTNIERVRRHLSDDHICHICNDEDETVLHMVRDCTFAALCWKNAALGLARTGDNSFNSLEWLRSHCQEKRDNTGRIPHASIFAYIIWFIWKSRNAWIFEGVPLNAERVVRNAYAQAEEYNVFTSTQDIKQLKVPKRIKWLPHCFKLNCDDSSWGSGREAGAGGVIRNHKGEWILRFTINIGKADNFNVELRGLRQGLLLARELDLKRVIVEIDSEGVLRQSRTYTTNMVLPLES